MKHWILIALIGILVTAGLAAHSEIAEASGPQLALVVNTLFDDPEDPGDIGDGICDIFPLVSGHTCSLRAAIEELNAYGASTGANHEIHFDFSGPTPYTIAPGYELPPIQVPMDIDGTTVAGASCPSGAGGVATLHMVLDGSSTIFDADGLYISSAGSGSAIKGLVIGNFEGTGIYLRGDDTTVQCNLIGVGPDGVTAMANNSTGIIVNSSNNTIGGQGHAHRNVLSGNDGYGLRLEGDSTNTVVEGNYIGTTADGSSSLANDDGAVYINGNNNQIGGTASLSGNFLAGGYDFDSGLRINGGDQNKVWGNHIGFAADGVTPLGFGLSAIYIGGNAIDNEIGGVNNGEANTIANNWRDGVSLSETQGNYPQGTVIRGNSIFDNNGLGIDLDNDGVTANDGVPDSDTGSNGLLNHPVLSDVKTDGVDVFYTLSYEGQVGFHDFDLYLNDSCNGSGYGEGQTHVLANGFITGGSGAAVINSDFAQTGAAGKYLVATATYGNDGTSEFSECEVVADLSAYIVNNKADLHDFDTGDGRCDTDSNSGNGHNCTLRAAIEQTNASGALGPVTIDFAIPDSGSPGEVIIVDAGIPLPTITHPVILDATTQPGAACPDVSTPASIYVTLDGTLLIGDALTLGAGSDGSVIKGFSIVNFTGDGIQINSNNNNIQCNHIGVARDGLTGAGNSVMGVDVAGDGNTIGGSTHYLRNVISANFTHGIRIDNAQDNNFYGNYIGLGGDGQTPLGNGQHGIRFWNGDNSTISDNVASSNTLAGISLASGSDNNTLSDNRVGLDVSGLMDRGNMTDGIEIDNSHSNTIEGNYNFGNGSNGIRLVAANNNNILNNLFVWNDADGITINNADNNTISQNTMQANSANGIAVRSLSQQNAISQNKIYDNVLLSIDLNEDGVTANDPAPDSDGGGNNLQNHPVLHKAAMDLVVVGTLESAYSTEYTLEFFHSSSCLGTGAEEGETYLGKHDVMTDGSGIAEFTATLDVDVNPGDFIVATATSPANDTSEFSACLQVSEGLIINNTDDAPDLAPGDGNCDANASVEGPQCTLRTAIEEVNALAESNINVYFAIEDSTPIIIIPKNALPDIQAPVQLDAITYQAGAVCFSDLKVEVDGSGITDPNVDGLVFAASSAGSLVQGLAIGNFSGSGLVLGGKITARCNYAGLRADGTTTMPNTQAGIVIRGDGATIGGTNPTDGNITSGNGTHGIWVDGSSVTRSSGLIRWNLAGTDKTGTLDKGNSSDGIRIEGGSDFEIKQNTSSGNGGEGVDIVDSSKITLTENSLGMDSDKASHAIPNAQGVSVGNSNNIVIGGDSNFFLFNVISGNTYSGVRVNSGVSNLDIVGNLIGHDWNGVPTPNGTHGIFLNGPSGVQIGDGTSSFANVIADNGLAGIYAIGSGTGNTWRGNAIVDNSGLGVDLNGNSAVDPNDADDGDGGANGTQNFPVLTNASPNGGSTEVIGSLESIPGGTYTVDFYRSDSCDGSGHGEGTNHVGSLSLPDGNGNAFFYSLPGPVSVGDTITAIATDSAGSSSEFSACIQVTNCTPPATINPAIGIQSGSVQLTWSSVPVSNYKVFRGVNDPYFVSPLPYASTTGTTWTDGDSDEIGNVAENHYYYVRGNNGCAGEIGQRVGEFDFGLVPGN